MKKVFAFLFMLAMFLSGLVQASPGKRFSAPPRSVSGVVTDAGTGSPLQGATIAVRNTSTATSSDVDGRFSITVPSDDAVIEVSFVGYVKVSLPVKGQNVFSVKLNKDINSLDEVVVVGYGTQKKGDLTSAVSSVKQENFVKGFVRDAAQLIQGKVAGLSVSTSSGSPTAGTQIQLRGITTLNSSTAPLVLIDGVPGNLNSVAPEDIEAVDVLKDGSAAAIYGTRGTNGVILITTKQIRGGATRSVVEYNTYVSLQTIARRPRFLNGSEFRKFAAEGYPFIDYGLNTDWFKTISRDAPFSQTHNLSFQGGNKNTNYTATVNYRNWEGMFLKSVNRQVTLRADVNHSMFDGKVKVNLNVINRQRNDDGGFNSYVYRQSVIRNPTDSIYDFMGRWKERNIYFYDNPLAYIMETIARNENQETRLSGSITASPVRGLNLKLLAASVKNQSMSGSSETKKHVSTTKNGRNGNASRSTSYSLDNLLEFTADYTRSFGKHRVTALAGYSYQDSKDENFGVSNWDFPTDAYSYNRLEGGNALGRGEASMSSFASSWKLIGFFGRVNYNFDDKYMLSASIRREGSSKFGANNKWGTFPAVSGAWRVKNEPFMRNVSFISDLKLRAGFGVTGIAPSASYLSLTSLNYGTRFLDNGVWIQSLSPVRNPNPDLRWERKEEFNFGVDISVLKGRLSATVDVYNRTTRDMLYNYSVPVPPYLFNSILANVGVMENKGVEVLVNYNAVQKKDFLWETSVNFSTNSNKLVSLSNSQFRTTSNFFTAGGTGEPVQDYTHRVDIGGPIGNFHGYKSVDIDANGLWIIEGADGKPKPYSQAKQDDKKILGNGLPKYYAGWNNTVRYKNWDLNVLMRGAFGFQILNFQRMFYENSQPQILGNYNVLLSAFDKVYGKTRLTNSQAYVSYYIENGDYWKVDNITLGYNVNLKSTKYVKSLRLYASGLNMFTITGYKGIDPEVNRGGLAPGNDERDKYPTTRTFTLGALITL
ncbi:SusC/RagA family TonB-linked outer membrane protein [Sediminibacterium soli]|uniref:SusC/RagA family TonB-linked outer membrane protein n=1 Tax=Sediminibacterium soli TaxID=2698829 RepID=UPI00137A930A|nr:TonB-dependent receptor [Sediminibacterium soli]NCI46781.1 TonB-dependent receptor [Sediminibacterium soli]